MPFRLRIAAVAVSAVAAVCGGGIASVARAQTTTLNSAAAYNLFTFSDASNQNTEVAGKVAIGGSGAFSSFTFFSDGQNGGVNHTPVAVVGGGLTYANGTAWGSFLAGGSVTASSMAIEGDVSANGKISVTNGAVYGTINHTATLPFDFGSYQQSLTSQSAYLKGLAANTTQSGGTYTFAGTGSNSLGVINLTAASFASAYSLNINAPASATVIVNVSGNGKIVAPNQGNFVVTSGGIALSHVLFNFDDATEIDLSSFNSSILAPQATIRGASGQFNGSLIGYKFVGGGLTLRDGNLFAGKVTGPPTGVPEPSALLLMAMGSVGGAWARRRRK